MEAVILCKAGAYGQRRSDGLRTNGGSLFPVEAIQSSVPYFTRNGLEMNAEVELGTFLLTNGASSYSGEGNGYRRSDCYWGITKRQTIIHDGIRDLHFDAICYIPESAISTAANRNGHDWVSANCTMPIRACG
ncbi:MAG: hypothetical protein ACLUD2_16375 [Clostridium sp.]